jgi:alcohol dehydrogenase class IV
MGQISNPAEMELFRVLEGLLSSAEPSMRILVISGSKTARALGLTGWAKETPKNEKSLQVWEHSNSLVTDTEAQAVCDVVKALKPDVIVGLGGGVVMDLAKIASAEGLSKSEPLTSQNPEGWATRRPLLVPLILIPTLFGSGAEATFHSVIYRAGQKHSMAFSPTEKMSSVLIAGLATSASRESRLFSALDAVCQAVETSWSKSSNVVSRETAIYGLRDVIFGFESYVNGIHDHRSQRFVSGANKIGISMNTGKTTAPHALSYILTSQAGIPHGYAVALIFKRFWENAVSKSEEFETDETLKKTLQQISEAPKVSLNTQDDFALWLSKVFETHSLNSNLGGILVQARISVNEFLDSANLERLTNHPVQLTKIDIREILQISEK